MPSCKISERGRGTKDFYRTNPDVVSFLSEGSVYFNLTTEIIGKTVILDGACQLRQSDPSWTGHAAAPTVIWPLDCDEDR